MKIIIAPDSFKENLTSMEVAKAIETGVKRVLPKAECIKIPMADGGEGTVQSFIDAAGGQWVSCRVKGPVGRTVEARYGMLIAKKTAVIEMAAASGLALVTGKNKNPLKTTSYGTGQIMVHAMNRGAKKIILGIGGSATNDGGVGMAQALGVVFRDDRGHIIRQNGAGGMLSKIHSIHIDDVHKKLNSTQILVACDVDNPFYGKRGAAYVFAPQKGATRSMVKRLDQNLKHLARVIKRDVGIDIAEVPGAGAAGGVGGGLLAFTHCELKSGIDIISKATAIEKHMKSADLILTGEGRVDFQTAFGKTPAGIARLAKKHNVPVIAIGGAISDDAREIFSYGIHGLEAAITRDMQLSEALKNSKDYIANAAERAMRFIMIGREMKNK